MHGQLQGQVVAVYVQAAALAAHAAVPPLVPVWDPEPPALVADEAVEGDPAAGAQPERDLVGHLERARRREASGRVLLGRHAGHGAPPPAGLLRAPQQRLLVERGDVGEVAAGKEVALHEADQPLDLALGEGVARLAEPGAEADAPHEGGVVALPDGPAVEVAPGHDRLHVVREHLVGDAHGHEGVEHPYEQVLLPRVGEELHVEAAAVVANHREARDPVLRAARADDRDEAPVHLIRLAGPRSEPLAAAPLWCHGPPLCGDEVPVAGYVRLHGGEAALVALAEQPLVDHLRVGDSPAELVVDETGVPREHRHLGPPAAVAVRERPEAVLPDRPGLRPREARPAAELRQVARLGVEPVARLGGHLLQGLVYNLL